jgi:hypothetical protein
VGIEPNYCPLPKDYFAIKTSRAFFFNYVRLFAYQSIYPAAKRAKNAQPPTVYTADKKAIKRIIADNINKSVVTMSVFISNYPVGAGEG